MKEEHMEFHPFADIFPLLEGAEFDALVADIKANGQREPIWVVLKDCPEPGAHKCYAYDESKCDLELGDGVWHCRVCDHNPALVEHQILDGRNRYRACLSLGIEPWTELYDGDDALAFVVSLNLHRRHLSESQRAMVAAKIANMAQGERTDIEPSANLQKVSQAKAAEMLNVSARTVATATKVRDEGAPELVRAVEAGKVSVSAAADVATLPKQEQAEIVARGEKEILEAAKQIRAERSVERKAERTARALEMAARAEKLTGDRKYRVIYADPPWSYGDKRDDSTGTNHYTGAEHHYVSMSIEELCALPVRDLALDDAVLFLWVTSPLLYEAAPLIDAWGFKYKASFVWDKVAHNVGHYNSVRHELLLICTRGSCTPDVPVLHDSVQSIERTKRHSEKPEEFRVLIDAMYPHGARIELFRRGAAPAGWDVWGNEANAA